MNKRDKTLLIVLLSLLVIITTVTSVILFRRIINKPEENIVQVENLTQYDFKDSLKTNGPLTTKGLTAKGKVDVLVVPISFHKNTEDRKLLNDINIAFNGTKEQTGYVSVSDFYYMSSYEQLLLNFDVLPEFYQPKFDASFYEKSVTSYGSTLLFKEILANLDPSIDFSKYDNDKDGYIDSVWMIYTHPVDTIGDSFWWAYVANDGEVNTNDNVKGYTYGFAGTDFLNPFFFKENKNYKYEHLKIDTHTYIHETGHMFGLDDYYDYDSIMGVKNGGTYGYDYMDYNYGDHGPMNKLLLDWINPVIVNDVCNVDIKPFQESGEVYLVTKKFKGTIYDSYYLIINYTNQKLYELDPYFEEQGILVYEINAELNMVNNKITSNGGTYDTGFKYDNSDENKLFINLLTSNELLDMNNVLFTKGEKALLTNYNMTLKVNEILSNGNIRVSFK